jgi:hypothetical protein
MEMIQRGENDAFSLRDLPIRGIHVGDDPGVVFDDVTVAIDDSGCELTGHSYIPPN